MPFLPIPKDNYFGKLPKFTSEEMLSNILPFKTLPLRKYKVLSIKLLKNLIKQMLKSTKRSD